MNKNYNFRDVYLDNYYSPFPRQKSNREVLNYSQTKKLSNNTAIIDIPPSVTLSYMRKNPIYFETKKYSNRVSKGKSRPKTAINKKIPDYIYEFKIRNFIEREYERLVDEEKGYPPGTFKVWDEDRILILTNLFLIREELLDKLRHFPVDYFLRSIGIRNKRRETEKKLDEVEYAIKIFQLTDVYLKM